MEFITSIFSSVEGWFTLSVIAMVAGWIRSFILSNWKKRARRLVDTTFYVVKNLDEVSEAGEAWHSWWEKPTKKNFRRAVEEGRDCYMIFANRNDKTEETE